MAFKGNCYKTIFKESFAEITKKRSKFLGFAKPIRSDKKAIFYIDKIKSEHRLAKHCVYVYRIYENNKTKTYESTEPQGSVGPVMLDVLKKAEIFDCIIVIVRYFGGILLGKSGLSVAYRECAKAVLDKNQIGVISYCLSLKLACNYSDYEKISRVILNMEGKINETLFSEKVSISFYLKKDCFERFCEFLKSFFKKDVIPNVLDEGFLR